MNSYFIRNEIIKFLKNTDQYISGEELSRSMNISRAGIWKYMQALRKTGYAITAVPHLGYRLDGAPDKLFEHEIRHNLSTKTMGCEVFHYDKLDSTMDIAFKKGMEGVKEGSVICAETQSKGKGRQGRNWESPKSKGIYLSIVMRPPLPLSDVAQLTLMSAVALNETIRHVTGLNSSIKWPNDILINNKKTAGILTELSAELDRVRFVVVGFGINVNTSQSALPSTGTSLKIEMNKPVSRLSIVRELLIRFEKWYDILKVDGFGQVLGNWKQNSSTLGRRVKISDAYGKIEGEAIDLDTNGALMIKNDEGVTVKRMSGDVVQV